MAEEQIEEAGESLSAGMEFSKVDLSSPTVASVAIEAFLRIMDLWSVPPHEAVVLLGNPPPSMLRLWKEGKTSMPDDTLNRVSHILAIYTDLQSLFDEDSRQADEWVNRPNKAFNGKTALQRMREGSEEDIEAVRNYLDAVTMGLG